MSLQEVSYGLGGADRAMPAKAQVLCSLGIQKSLHNLMISPLRSVICWRSLSSRSHPRGLELPEGAPKTQPPEDLSRESRGRRALCIYIYIYIYIYICLCVIVYRYVCISLSLSLSLSLYIYIYIYRDIYIYIHTYIYTRIYIYIYIYI